MTAYLSESMKEEDVSVSQMSEFGFILKGAGASDLIDTRFFCVRRASDIMDTRVCLCIELLIS